MNRQEKTMSASDMQKVKNAGFTIIRRDYYGMRIKQFSQAHGWTTLENKFPSKKELDRRAKVILRSSLTIED